MQELTVAKSVEVADLTGGGNVGSRSILGLVEMHERFSRIDWGEGVEQEESRREMEDKKGGGLALLKMREYRVNAGIYWLLSWCWES